MKYRFFFMVISLGFSFFGQQKDNLNTSGMASLGTRTTVSAFNDDDNEFTGIGAGGQLRLRLSEHINTEWFFDYITSDILNYAHRTDYHIGWSVLFYPLSSKPYYAQNNGNLKYKSLFRPYILAGHCFDYSMFQDKSDVGNFADRWSSAVQAGLGCHYEITPRFDISITGQYMVHLGKHIDALYDFQSQSLVFEEEPGSALAGHLLLNMSLNYKITKLWHRD